LQERHISRLRGCVDLLDPRQRIRPQPVLARAHLVEQAAGFHPGIVAGEVDQRSKRLAQPRPAVQDHEHLRQHLFGIAVEHRARQPVLAAELAIERGLRDSRHLTDRVDRHIGRVALPISGHRDVEHLFGVHRSRSPAWVLRIHYRSFLYYPVFYVLTECCRYSYQSVTQRASRRMTHVDI
jgi:hypothetical protein